MKRVFVGKVSGAGSAASVVSVASLSVTAGVTLLASITLSMSLCSLTAAETSTVTESVKESVTIAEIKTLDQWAEEMETSLQRDDLDEPTLARVKSVTERTVDFSVPEPFERLSAGKTTSRKAVDHNSFSHFSANLSYAQQQQFGVGNAIFRKSWVSSPASTLGSDGLGPLFNARSCQGCHLKDGRGHPPQGVDDDTTSFLLKLAVPAKTEAQQAAIAHGEMQNIAEPHYGGQFQDKAVAGLAAEGKIDISYQTLTVTLADGEVIHLQKPTYALSELQYGEVDPELMLSPRVAPQMIGLGLVEQIHPADLLANADPDDSDGNGISGRVSVVRAAKSADKMATSDTVSNVVSSSVASEINSDTNSETGASSFTIGRFGWKASQPTVRAQSAGAFAADIGISTEDVPLHAGDCTEYQQSCLAAPNGVQASQGRVEAPEPLLSLTTFYSQNLAVPQRRDIEDKQVLRGKKLFYQIGCADCHVPKFVTRKDAENPALAFQLIWPYSDFLLHDMGPELADGFPAGSANGQEWRTAPLWGTGLTEAVNGHTRFLHDGRARNLLEAVLWHGGEAEAAKQKVVALASDERQDLLAFLGSL